MDILYYQGLLRLADAGFVMIKFSVYAYTAYTEKFNEQESLYFYVRIAKFICTTYIFYVFFKEIIIKVNGNSYDENLWIINFRNCL